MATNTERFLSASDVLARMRRGELPTTAGESFAAVFIDGKRARQRTMLQLFRAGKIASGNIGQPWTLTDAGKDASQPMDAWRSWPVAAKHVVPVMGNGLAQVTEAKRQAGDMAKSWNQCTTPYVSRVFERTVKAGGVGCTVFVVVVRRKPEGVK